MLTFQIHNLDNEIGITPSKKIMKLNSHLTRYWRLKLKKNPKQKNNDKKNDDKIWYKNKITGNLSIFLNQHEL